MLSAGCPGARSFNAGLLLEPWALRTGQAGPIRCSRRSGARCRRWASPRAAAGPGRAAPPRGRQSLELDQLDLRPRDRLGRRL